MGLLAFSRLSTHGKTVSHDVSIEWKPPSPTRKPRLAPNRPPRHPLHLPIEIIMTVLESAYYSSDHLEPDIQTLNSCALISRSWSSAAQKLLFRHVSLKDEAAYTSFLSAADPSTERGRAIGETVVRMRVIVDHNQPRHLEHLSFARALTLCPNLYELNVSLFGDGPSTEPNQLALFDDETLSTLALAPPITALHLTNTSPSNHYLHQLLSSFPTLQSLSLSGVPPRSLPEASYFPCALSELRMNFQTKPSADFMKWLLHHSASGKSLRVLELEREPSNDMLEYLLCVHGETIESLSLPSCHVQAKADLIGSCHRLKELKIERTRGSPAIFQNLPSSIQHLAIGVDGETPLEAVLSLVKRTGGQLQAVTVCLWEGGSVHPTWCSLKMECAERGVEVRVVRDVRAFRAMVRGDPLPAASFPRTRAISNLNRMRSARGQNAVDSM